MTAIGHQDEQNLESAKNRSFDDEAYAAALAVFQLHHDLVAKSATQTVSAGLGEDDLVAAYMPYLMRWERQIRKSAYRYGFTKQDVDDVVQDATLEFFEKKVLTGIFDPSRAQFWILHKLLVQRAIDRHRAIERWNGINGAVGDFAAGATPTDDPTGDSVLRPRNLEEALTQACRGANLDPRATAVMVYRLLDREAWHRVLLLVNDQFPPPVAEGTLRNNHSKAKKRLREYLERNDDANESSF
jgi:DNA-directed RNA polymerase specialized sigma24 family protein